jgi:hypothetical protein
MAWMASPSDDKEFSSTPKPREVRWAVGLRACRPFFGCDPGVAVLAQGAQVPHALLAHATVVHVVNLKRLLGPTSEAGVAILSHSPEANSLPLRSLQVLRVREDPAVREDGKASAGFLRQTQGFRPVVGHWLVLTIQGALLVRPASRPAGDCVTRCIPDMAKPTRP